MRSLIALTALLIATPAVAGSPWISIELPANPYDQAKRGAYLVVHTWHHEMPAPYVITGTAEGLVNGERRSIRLNASSTGRTGSFVVRQNWPREGVWVLKIGIDDVAASAAVGVSADGQVSFVRVPTTRSGEPRQLAGGEVETMLRALADGRPVPALASAGGGMHGSRRAKAFQLGSMTALGGAALVGLFAAFRRRMKNRA